MRFIRIVTTALLLLGATLPSLASELFATTTIGFADRFRLGAWTPVQVSVLNLGAAFDARVSVSLGAGNALDGNAHRVTQQRTVHLASGVRRRLGFTFFISSFAHPLTVTITQGDQEILRQETPVRPRYSGQRLALIVSSDLTIDYLGGAAAHACDQGDPATGACSDAESTEFARVYPPLDELPRVWFGYDGVDALIVRGLRLEQLTEAQYSALLGWLVKGGRLIVAATPNVALMTTPRLRALLPVLPTGLRENQRLDQGFPMHAIADGPYVSARLNGAPLIAQRRLGRGTVVYITADVAQPGFEQWPGAAGAWRNALGLDNLTSGRSGDNAGRTTSAPQDALFRANNSFGERIKDPSATWVENVLLELPLPWPSLITVLLFSFGYLALLAAADPGRTTRTGRRIVLAVMPALTCCVLATVVFTLKARDGPNLFSLALVERLPDLPYANARYEVGIFSRDRHAWAWHSQALTPAWRHVPRPYESGPRSADDIAAADDDAVHWIFSFGQSTQAMHEHRGEVAQIRPYVVETLVGEDVIHVPAFASRTTAAGQSVLELDNGTPSRWHASWLVSGRTVTSTGALNAGASSTQTITPKSEAVSSVPSSAWQQRLADAPLGEAYPHFAVAQAVSERVELLRAQQPSGWWLVAITDSPLALRLESVNPARTANYGVLIIPVSARSDTRG